MRIYGGIGDIFPPFLTDALYTGEWLASRPGHFSTGEGANRVGLDAMEKIMSFQVSNPYHLVHILLPYRLF
jgi:hypothetical protein